MKPLNEILIPIEEQQAEKEKDFIALDKALQQCKDWGLHIPPIFEMHVINELNNFRFAREEKMPPNNCLGCYHGHHSRSNYTHDNDLYKLPETV